MSQEQRLKLKPYPSLAPPPPQEVTVAYPAYTEPLFRGPLGIWPWPLVNLILTLVNRLRTLQAPAAERTPVRRIYSITRDQRGRIIEITEFVV